MLQQRPETLTKFGLEVASGLTYQGWEPGGEYTRKLVLRNVQFKSQKIRYKISGSQFFSAVYPQPVVLSAGTSYTLPITFRPCRKQPYEEAIEFQTPDGRFTVPIRALLPKASISLCSSLKFDMCAVGGQSTRKLEISNNSAVPTSFSWEVPDCFEISPSSGFLAARETCELTATFKPQAAVVYDTTAVCSFGTDTKTIKLEGIGKYPHVTVKVVKKTKKSPDPQVEGGSGVVVDFGGVAIGTVAEKWLEITNISPVKSVFSITPLSPTTLSSSLFACSEYKGHLEPQTNHKDKRSKFTHRVKILYAPSIVTDHPSIGYFSVKALGGLGNTSVKCIGWPKGPQVCIEESVVNFGNVECGQTATGIMHIWNNSDIPATFQLQLDSHSVFHVEALCGQLPPKSSKTVIVHFSPHRPIPYCRRVACLVHHQEPLFVYFIGTSFTETVRPVVLQPQHITHFLTHAHSGLSMFPPEQLKQYLQEGKLSVDTSGALVTSKDFKPPIPDDTALQWNHQQSACSQYLHSEHEPSGIPHVSADVELLKFGYCSPKQTSESKLVSITNHTCGVLCCVWMSRPSDAFHVVPEEQEILGGKTGSFTVSFKPGKPSQFYAKEMECFIFYKGLCDYRHVDHATISLPWCITVRASGHTFAPGTEAFLPRLTFDPRSIVFPATTAGRPVYRTAVVKNAGDTPAMFDLSQDDSGTFVVKPSHGLVQDSYQVFVLQMLPREPKVYKHILKCYLNARQRDQQELLLSGSGEVPTISLQNEGQLFLRPTCVSTTATAYYSITNTSRLPVAFDWKLAEVEPGVIRVQPSSGVILPNETQTHTWLFTPHESRQYSLKVVLQATLEGTTTMEYPPRKFKAILSISGQGTCGEIKCAPSSLECGTVIIGTSQSHSLDLFNPSPSTLYYQLCVEQETPQERWQGGSVIEISKLEGVIQAHSHDHVKVTVRPSQGVHYSARIKYQLLSHPQAMRPVSTPPESDSTLCTVEVSGAYPTLRVTDVQGEGSASTMSKARMWHMLSIRQLNMYLCEEPSVPELRYAIATRHSMRRRVSVHTRAVVDFNFGAAPVNSESSTVHLMVENEGDVTTEWAFQFPSDMHLEPEYWADTGKMNEAERHELNVVSNELFTVRPKRGRLQPGEKTTVVCSFKHTQIGTSKLPVLLKINRGREILLSWSGVTVDHAEPYVHFTSHQHKFSPVPIGTHAFPKQVYELHNAGDTAVGYVIDTLPLDRLRENNYLMTILECLQAKGEIPAGGTAHIEFVFSPLEARKYTVDIPIHFSNGDTALVTFTGEGYDLHCLMEGLPDSQSEQSIPLHQAISVPGQLGHLSQERLGFGHLPLFAVVRQPVFVTNTSSHTLSYEWDLGSEIAQEVLSVQPPRGYIQPGNGAICKITFCSHSSPACYDLDITCKVMDESELLSYNLQLQEWERLQDEKKHVFTITETEGSFESIRHKTKKRPQTMPKLSSLSKSHKVRPRSSDGEQWGRYQTLPPIGYTKETYDDWKRKDLSVKSKSRPRAQKPSQSEPPVPPQPLLLHLGVTARTHSVPDYAQLFDTLDSFYIDQHTLMADGLAERGRTLTGISVRGEEKEMTVNVLSQMIRELLDDTNFHSAMQRVLQEPIPHFTQFASHNGPSEATKQPAHRHLYATGLPSGDHPPPLLPDECLVDSAEETLLVQSEDEQVHSLTSILEEQDVTELDEKIKHLPEFTSLVEAIVENTLLNILNEANSGELNITAPIYTLAKPLGTETAA